MSNPKYFVINGKQVEVEQYSKERLAEAQRSMEEQEARAKAERLKAIDEVLPTLWYLLELHAYPQSLLSNESEQTYAFKMMTFQTIARNLTGEQWHGEQWC